MQTLASLRDGAGNDTRLLPLAPVDVLVIAGLAIMGRLHHGYPLLEQPLDTLETMVPFLVGWLIVSVLTGAYTENAVRTRGTAVLIAVVTWIGAANIGLILRSSTYFDGGATWPFNLIMTAVGVVALGGWRLAYASVR